MTLSDKLSLSHTHTHSHSRHKDHTDPIDNTNPVNAIGLFAGTEATGVGTAPGVYLREDPICGTQLENQSELRAPSADKAALYLDAALAARSATGKTEQDIILVFVTPLFWGVCY